MKTIILAGGLGTRLAEYTSRIPKPMVEIGEHPILWHIMNWYSKYGYNDFIIALGFKATVIKEYFLNYHSLNNDFKVDLSTGEHINLDKNLKPWKIDLIDTGVDTMTGGRIKRLKKYIGNETFMVTYGDGLSNIDISELVKFHKLKGKIATLTAVRPTARFGELIITEDNLVSSFKEKPQLEEGRINGGFFVMEPSIFDYIDGDASILEKETLETLVNENQLAAFKHNSFWQSMDTVREKQILDELWKSNIAPWKI